MFLTLATMTEVYGARALALLKDRKGVSSLEYAILAVGIIAAVAAATGVLAPALKTAFTNIGTSLGGAT